MSFESEIVSEKIKKIEIQGAMNVAKAALIAFSKDIIGNPDEDPGKFIEILSNARPNEPMLRNTLKWFLGESKGLEGEAVLSDLASSILEEIEAGEKRIFSYGAELIHDGMKIFTHCHSSTAVGILKEAKNQGKNQYVFFDQSLEAAVEGRALMERNLRKALNQKEIVLWYSRFLMCKAAS